MNADDILNALRKAWPSAAIVPELEIRDEYAYAQTGMARWCVALTRS